LESPKNILLFFTPRPGHRFTSLLLRYYFDFRACVKLRRLLFSDVPSSKMFPMLVAQLDVVGRGVQFSFDRMGGGLETTVESPCGRKRGEYSRYFRAHWSGPTTDTWQLEPPRQAHSVPKEHVPSKRTGPWLQSVCLPLFRSTTHGIAHAT